MLSRNAERVYWLGRYIERVEDTARLLNAFSHVMLDLPKSKKLGWEVLLRIMSTEEQFQKLYGDDVTEHNVITFLLADSKNSGSIRSSVKAARENARTSRDIIPLEGWEMLNDLHILVKKSATTATQSRHRFRFLTEVIARCQQFNGMIQNALSRDQAYVFLEMGSLIERADMTSRTLDVAAGVLLRRHEDESSYDTHIWLEILKAQNAVMMYRAANGPRIAPKTVLHFILCKEDFPRSIKFCLEEMRLFAHSLPRNQAFIAEWDKLSLKLDCYEEHSKIEPEALHEFFDDIQKGIIQLHSVTSNSWFPAAFAPLEEQSQTQTIVEEDPA